MGINLCWELDVAMAAAWPIFGNTICPLNILEVNEVGAGGEGGGGRIRIGLNMLFGTGIAGCQQVFLTPGLIKSHVKHIYTRNVLTDMYVYFVHAPMNAKCSLEAKDTQA